MTTQIENKSLDEIKPDQDFDLWWSTNHPSDWWKRDRNGEPLPHQDRHLVWKLSRMAWAAGRNREVERKKDSKI